MVFSRVIKTELLITDPALYPTAYGVCDRCQGFDYSGSGFTSSFIILHKIPNK